MTKKTLSGHFIRQTYEIECNQIQCSLRGTDLKPILNIQPPWIVN